MTAPVFTGPVVLGPGELKIGATGTEIDVSCMINGARITAAKDQADDVTALCGTVFPGSVTYTASLTGNLHIDPSVPGGLFDLSWVSPGTQQAFTFTPNTEDGTTAAGTLIIDPLDFGADAYADKLASDFEFSIVGDVTYTRAGGAVAVFATGVPVRSAPIPPRTAAAAKSTKSTRAKE